MFGWRIRRRLHSATVFATIFMLMSGAVARGQDTTSLSGVISDPQGKVIPGATVTITYKATGVTREAKSKDDGSYAFNQLPPGAYSIRVEAKGFKTNFQEDTQLLVATPTKIDMQLEVGAVSETVTVSGGEVQLNTQDATIGNAFNQTQIRQLPLEGRNVAGLLSLQPGVTFIGSVNADGGTTDYRNGSVNGGKSDQGNVTLDGVDVNDQQSGQAFNSVLRVTLDSVQEFRVVTTNPNADQGRSSGAQISLVTKGGTNNWHGSLYEFHRNTIFSANDWFNNSLGTFTPDDFAVQAGQANVGEEKAGRPKLLRNVFGGSVGGPLKKDRLFFFVNYEGRRDSREESVVRTVPGLDLRKGTFTYFKFKSAGSTETEVAKLDAAGVTALEPRHLGPNPAVLQIFNQYPAPNDTTVGDGLNTFGFRFNSPIHLRWNTYIARFDYNLTQDGKHTLFWRGNLQNDRDNSTQQFPGQPARFTNLTNNKGFAAGYNASLTQNIVNVFHAGFTRLGFEQAGSSAFSDSRLVSFRTFSDLIPATRSLTRFTPVWNVVDDLAWIKGAHSMQFGTNIRWIRNERINFENSFPDALVNKAWLVSNRPIRPPLLADTSADHAIAALLGLVTQVTARYNLDREGDNLVTLPEGAAIKRRYGADEYEFYGQDSWRLKPNLTITAGLRYSLYSPPWETRGLQVSPDVPLADWFNTRGGEMVRGVPDNQSAPPVSFVLSGPKNGRKGFYDWDKNNFAPRFAFAYSPRTKLPILRWLTGGEANKMAIRGGYGVVFDRIGGALATNADSGTLSFGLQTEITNPAAVQTVATVPRFTGLNNIPSSLLLPAAGFGSFPATFPIGTEAGGFAITAAIDDGLTTPYSQTINFAISRELPGNMVFEAAYVGRLARHVLINWDLAMPLNLVDPASGMDYFTAAQQLVRLERAGVDITKVPKIPFWENIFPDLKDAFTDGTATQNAFLLYSRQDGFGPDYTTSLNIIDVDCDPCSKFGPFAFFNGQFSNLNALRSMMPTNYHALQLLLRKRFARGFQFDFNYTYSKSQDYASVVERNGLFTGSVFNSWAPAARKSVSDFDLTHQVNINGIWELPFGKGRRFLKGSSNLIDAFAGGWQLSGIYRVTSGLPTSIGNGFAFPTNWEFTGFATQDRAIPHTGVTKNVKVTPDDNGGPNLFADPEFAFDSFSNTLPGGVGSRNTIRGDGFFTLDMGLAKSWTIRENARLQFRWEVFNVTNSVSFDPTLIVGDDLDSRGTFGKYSGVLSSPRVMQFGLRFEF
ncbi:MAG TPA: carboxypeptidase-like regulatory domain-containing protein [Blastocatellia bacterium]|nr:carboxypeptidase-like regulatory domain-containing protein [Blastocatellia bacterium]